ncbi:PTS fructose transporter subunit IIB [Clostridium sp. ZS2-4]|uniref:PTS fructose transporter subunit IIB n=1 Tax=Clostridium sp. ZS2-4 TaxID=2987703 RepID=UPI00227C6445|nr:fructose PTS transporter subunit IIB [Clostridium sp. ZS2-4]MCY6354440.1 fructose PTS transporter subunit IIB [Clostridium sp. ZS2-4]
MKKIVGLCACPTGIAHTYMAADAIEAAAKKLGHKSKVETQGSIGIEEKLTKKDLEEADLIIISAAIKIREVERFEAFEDKIIRVPLQKTIASIDKIIKEKLD